MKVVEGNFGKEKEEEISASEFLSLFAVKAMQQDEEGKNVRCAVIMYEDREVFEVASNQQYPEGVHMLLQMAAQAILNETLGVTE